MSNAAGLSVFSKEFIKRRTRFGPLQAPRKKGYAYGSGSNVAASATAGRLEFHLFKGGSASDRRAVVCLNTAIGNEDSCNWMVLVAPARNHHQQNLVAFQYNAAIYFVTIKVRRNLLSFFFFTENRIDYIYPLTNNILTRGLLFRRIYTVLCDGNRRKV
jgi:hypothetical protein